MKFLVDTHIFIWMFGDTARFSEKVRGFLEDVESNQFFFSDASAWEASMKYGLGKLHLPETPETFFPDRVRRAEYRHLRIDLSHVTQVHSLPQIHGDPFDRLLVAQALIEGLTIVTDDPVIKGYKSDTLLIKEIS